MDSTLVGVTLLSMTMASALSVIVWRMLRVERRRSEARVMALAELAAHQEPLHVAQREAVVHHEPVAQRDEVSHRERAAAPSAQAVRPAHDLTLRDTPAAATMFAASEPSSSPWRTRIAVMGGLGLALAAIVLFGLAARERHRAATPRPAATRSAAATMPAAPELELWSLHDTRQAGTLTITGLVQNPRGGAMLTRVSVTAFAFDANGTFLASGRALLDITALAPGDESPFVVTVPVTESVARYRIGFRGDDGRVIAHVDRRQQGAVAGDVTRATAGT